MHKDVIILPSYTNMHMKWQDSSSSTSNGSRILYVRYTKFVAQIITTINNYVRPLSSISGLSDLHIWLVQMMIGKQSHFKSLKVTTINLDYSIDADDPTWYKFIHNSHPDNARPLFDGYGKYKHCNMFQFHVISEIAIENSWISMSPNLAYNYELNTAWRYILAPFIPTGKVSKIM